MCSDAGLDPLGEWNDLSPSLFSPPYEFRVYISVYYLNPETGRTEKRGALVVLPPDANQDLIDMEVGALAGAAKKTVRQLQEEFGWTAWIQ